jgi:beta-glucosidase-like glycosyl hydrolase
MISTSSPNKIGHTNSLQVGRWTHQRRIFVSPPRNINTSIPLTEPSNQVTQSRLDDMALRILAGWYFVNQDTSYPSVRGWSSWQTNVTGSPNVQGDHKSVARAIARDGIVLLKNENNALPLKEPATLAVVGYDAVLNPQGANACIDRKCNNGTLAMVCSAFHLTSFASRECGKKIDKR